MNFAVQTTDWRGLCEELLRELENCIAVHSVVDGTHHISAADAVIARARAALAAATDGPAVPKGREPTSVVGDPSDVDLLELMPQQFREDLATVSRMAAHGAGTGVTPGLFRVSLNTGALDYARAVLARYGHQPAPPAEGEPSNENCWEWYTYCPEEGIELYSSREQAQSAAQSIMGSYEVAAYSDGWHEDMESVSWGMLVPVEQAQVVERKTAEPGNEFDEWVKYKLVPARYGHQPAPPAEEEPEVVEPTDEELLELTEDWPATTGPRHDLSGCPEVPLYSVFADEVVEFARAVLARYGHHFPDAKKMVSQPAQPVEGEVGELVAWIRGMYWAHPDKERATRAADLLEQRHPAPVPVSERLPGPEDCDAEGRCWVGYPELTYSIADTGDTDTTTPEWRLEHQPLKPKGSRCCWLPATALPLPAGEMES